MLQKLASHGVADITITGGEAKLTKNFLKIIATASSLFTNVNLFSNGLNWRDDEIELISHLGNVSVQISIDGNSSTHDKLRGREGGFSESLKNAERFAQSSVPVLIAMTVNQLNYKEVYEVIEKSVEVGAVVFRAGQTIPVGRASEYQDMTSEMKEKVKQQLADAKKDGVIKSLLWIGKTTIKMIVLQISARRDFCHGIFVRMDKLHLVKLKIHPLETS